MYASGYSSGTYLNNGCPVWIELYNFFQFPRPNMSQKIRLHGGIIVHIIVAIYMFIGLAVVCDEYFVASLDRICEGI